MRGKKGKREKNSTRTQETKTYYIVDQQEDLCFCKLNTFRITINLDPQPFSLTCIINILPGWVWFEDKNVYSRPLGYTVKVGSDRIR